MPERHAHYIHACFDDHRTAGVTRRRRSRPSIPPPAGANRRQPLDNLEHLHYIGERASEKRGRDARSMGA